MDTKPSPADLDDRERASLRQARIAGRVALVVMVCAVATFAYLESGARSSGTETTASPAESVSPPASAVPQAATEPSPAAGQTIAALPAPPPSVERAEPAERAAPSRATAPPTEAAATPPVDAPPGMVLVPAGEFMMGHAEAGTDERPPHPVYLSAFWIDKTEVTVADYLHCVAHGPCRRPLSNCSWAGAENGDDPISCVDWSEAHSYCRWSGKRLPTEAEWEKAARGTDQRDYPWGNKPPTCKLAAFHDQGDDPSAPKGCGRNKTWPVGSFPEGASPYGALDMAGNAWEWVSDWYSPDSYARSREQDPKGPEWGDMHVRRGGSWKSQPQFLNSAVRGRMDPAEWNDMVGFRCAKGE